MTTVLRILVLYCALIDMAHVADRAGQMQDLHQQLVKAAQALGESRDVAPHADAHRLASA
jgi:hypothetical protein